MEGSRLSFGKDKITIAINIGGSHDASWGIITKKKGKADERKPKRTILRIQKKGTGASISSREGRKAVRKGRN